MFILWQWLIRSRRRNARMPGFYWRFYFLKFIKSIACLSRLYLMRHYQLFSSENFDTIVYNPSLKNIRYFKNRDSKRTIFLVKLKNISYYSKVGLTAIPIEPVFCLANIFGLIGLVPFAIMFRGKEVILNSDFGLDEISLVIFARITNGKTVCLQHGLFPANNLNDLDGTFCNQVIVKSYDQVSIINLSGFCGDVIVAEDLFEEYPLADINKWRRQGCPIIFVGSGYFVNPNLRHYYTQLLLEIRDIFNERQVIYRSHPREKKYIPDEVRLRYIIDDTERSSLSEPSNYLFIGIKSTMLYEAANSGRAVFIFESKKFPVYFKSGSLNSFNNLNDMAYEINKLFCI